MKNLWLILISLVLVSSSSNAQVSKTDVTNDDVTSTQNYLGGINARIVALRKKMKTLVANDPESVKLAKEIESKMDSVKSYKINFMETHPNSQLSPSYLYVLQDQLPTELVERVYNSFPIEWKNSKEGKYVYSRLEAAKRVAIGKMAPDFSSTDTSGVKVKLSDFKGKYVLLEFWANWCVPCRALNPHLKTTYNKFKDKGFTILQYSIDEKKDEQKWKDAIKKDGLVWPQISDLSADWAPVASLYGVLPIPDSFLIGPDGVIIGRRLSPEALDEELSKRMNGVGLK